MGDTHNEAVWRAIATPAMTQLHPSSSFNKGIFLSHSVLLMKRKHCQDQRKSGWSEVHCPPPPVLYLLLFCFCSTSTFSSFQLPLEAHSNCKRLGEGRGRQKLYEYVTRWPGQKWTRCSYRAQNTVSLMLIATAAAPIPRSRAEQTSSRVPTPLQRSQHFFSLNFIIVSTHNFIFP